MNSIGSCYYNLGDYTKSLEHFQQALAIREKTNAAESLDYAMDCFYVGICHFYLGDIEDALSRFLQSLPILEKEPECDKDDYLGCLENIGYCYEEIGDLSKALKYYQQALTNTEIIYGNDHPRYAEFLDRIGSGYSSLGDYATAQKYFEQALEIWETKNGKESLDYAISLYNIGSCLGEQEDYENALDCYQRALAIFEIVSGKENENYLMCLGNIGSCYHNIGDYTNALEYNQQTLAIHEKLYGKEGLDYASCLNNTGMSYYLLGDYLHAIEYYRQALSVIVVIDKEKTDYAKCLLNIGNCYNVLGDYASALEYNQQALEMYEKLYGKESWGYASCLNGMGISYYRLGDYAKALECLHQTLSIFEVYGKEHPDYASCLGNIGVCYYDLGDFAKALEYQQQALAIMGETSSNELANIVRTAGFIDNIGLCYTALGKYDEALAYHQKALVIREKALGRENILYAKSLINVGLCYYSLRSNSDALNCFSRALDVHGALGGKDHLDYALALYNLACVYKRIDDHASALKYYQQALSIRKDRLGTKNIGYTSTLYPIAWRYYYLKDYSSAENYLVEWADNSAEITTSMFSFLPETQRELFWKNKYQSVYTNELYDLAVRLPSPICVRVAFNGALLGKGLLLNAETEMRKLILESGDEEALRMYNEVQESRVKLDKLYEDPVGKKEIIDSLNNDIESRQQELIKRSKVFGDYTRNLALKWTDVQASLGKKDVAIEFETYTHQDTTFYIALTLRPGYTEPHLVELFNSKDLGQINSNRYYSSTSMTDLVWGNLSDELEGVKNVYFSPAGELNNIGIEYLLDEDGKHLVSEKRNYYRLTSTRELAKEHRNKKMADATLYGGIRYDISPNSNLTGEETESERLALTATRSWMPMDSLSVTRGGWVYLPGTKEEAEAISSTLSSRKVHNDLLEGENGTEESFKALSGAKKDVIHIATHGFYWTETEAARSGMETSSFMLDGESRAPKEDKALTRSGLLFAGAQNAFEGKKIPIDVEDGILTAKDISRMDLRGTDIVVISACQSGLGEVTGDGVFGLQRGFKKAGVQSIVMSLWEVDDNATKLMMTRFYENLAKGRSKYEAFREAQKYLRKYENGRYDEPEYYAAFVLLDAIEKK